jgi:hypothetical protein
MNPVVEFIKYMLFKLTPEPAGDGMLTHCEHAKEVSRIKIDKKKTMQITARTFL